MLRSSNPSSIIWAHLGSKGADKYSIYLEKKKQLKGCAVNIREGTLALTPPNFPTVGFIICPRDVLVTHDSPGLRHDGVIVQVQHVLELFRQSCRVTPVPAGSHGPPGLQAEAGEMQPDQIGHPQIDLVHQPRHLRTATIKFQIILFHFDNSIQRAILSPNFIISTHYIQRTIFVPQILLF